MNRCAAPRFNEADLLEIGGSTGSGGSAAVNQLGRQGFPATEPGTPGSGATGSRGSVLWAPEEPGTPGTRAEPAPDSQPRPENLADFSRISDHGTPRTRATPENGHLRSAFDPAGPCPACRSLVWWRLAAPSGGPGPWMCERCTPPNSADWIDGAAVPDLPTCGSHPARW